MALKALRIGATQNSSLAVGWRLLLCRVPVGLQSWCNWTRSSSEGQWMPSQLTFELGKLRRGLGRFFGCLYEVFLQRWSWQPAATWMGQNEPWDGFEAEINCQRTDGWAGTRVWGGLLEVCVGCMGGLCLCQDWNTWETHPTAKQARHVTFSKNPWGIRWVCPRLGHM